jgi:hypothetical protein
MPAIAHSLESSIAISGRVVTLFAIAYAVGSPLATSVTAHWPRRPVLIASLPGDSSRHHRIPPSADPPPPDQEAPMRVIVVPADTQPCTSTTIHAAAWHTELSKLVGGPLDRAAYDWDVVLWVGHNSAAHLPANTRATRYAFGQSQAAALHHTDPDGRRTGCTAPWSSRGEITTTATHPRMYPLGYTA